MRSLKNEKIHDKQNHWTGHDNNMTNRFDQCYQPLIYKMQAYTRGVAVILVVCGEMQGSFRPLCTFRIEYEM